MEAVLVFWMRCKLLSDRRYSRKLQICDAISTWHQNECMSLEQSRLISWSLIFKWMEMFASQFPFVLFMGVHKQVLAISYPAMFKILSRMA
jgi:hypothetical protein